MPVPIREGTAARDNRGNLPGRGRCRQAHPAHWGRYHGPVAIGCHRSVASAGGVHGQLHYVTVGIGNTADGDGDAVARPDCDRSAAADKWQPLARRGKGHAAPVTVICEKDRHVRRRRPDPGAAPCSTADADGPSPSASSASPRAAPARARPARSQQGPAPQSLDVTCTPASHSDTKLTAVRSWQLAVSRNHQRRRAQAQVPQGLRPDQGNRKRRRPFAGTSPATRM